eukprot:6407940-Alexandrium_andersonii.AAC.1
MAAISREAINAGVAASIGDNSARCSTRWVNGARRWAPARLRTLGCTRRPWKCGAWCLCANGPSVATQIVWPSSCLLYTSDAADDM